MTADTSMHFQDSFARILHVAAHFQYNQYQRNNSRCMLAVSGMVYDKVKFLDPEDLSKWLCQVMMIFSQGKRSSLKFTSCQGQSSKLFKKVQ